MLSKNDITFYYLSAIKSQCLFNFQIMRIMNNILKPWMLSVVWVKYFLKCLGSCFCIFPQLLS